MELWARFYCYVYIKYLGQYYCYVLQCLSWYYCFVSKCLGRYYCYMSEYSGSVISYSPVVCLACGICVSVCNGGEFPVLRNS